MCSNQECINAEYCERMTGKRAKKQRYAYFLNEGNNCEWLMPNEKYKTFAILKNPVGHRLLEPGIYLDGKKLA